MKKILVTGANGFIGSSFIKKLLAEDVLIYAVDCSFEKDHLPSAENIKKITNDLKNIQTFVDHEQIGHCDALFHFAWQGVNGPDKADPYVQLQNVQMAVRVADFAVMLGCSRLFCAGTIAEESVHSLGTLEKTSGGMLYGIAKHCTRLLLETYCKHIDLPLTWMQFSNIYGPQNKTGNLISYTLGQLKKNEPATFGPAEQPYDFIYIDNLLTALVKLSQLDKAKDFYFIGSGTPRKLKEYLSQVGELYGKSNLIKIGVRPDDGIRYDFKMFDCSALKQDIGEYVSVSFEQGIQKTIDCYD